MAISNLYKALERFLPGWESGDTESLGCSTFISCELMNLEVASCRTHSVVLKSSISMNFHPGTCLAAHPEACFQQLSNKTSSKKTGAGFKPSLVRTELTVLTEIAPTYL